MPCTFVNKILSLFFFLLQDVLDVSEDNLEQFQNFALLNISLPRCTFFKNNMGLKILSLHCRMAYRNHLEQRPVYSKLLFMRACI